MEIPRRAWRAIGGSGPPTVPIAMRPLRSEMDEAAVNAAIGLALRIGELMLAVGAPAADVIATVQRVADALRLFDCHVDVTYTSITVSYDRLGAVPLTALRVVRISQADYTRLQGVTDVAQDVVDGLDVEEAHRRLDAITSAPATYRRSIYALGWAGVAGCFAFLLGGGWWEALLAAVTTAAVEQMLRILNRWLLPPFFQQAAGAALATGVAVLLVALEVDVRSSLVVAAGIVVLLAGLSLVSATQDAIDGFPVTAGGRAFEVVTLTTGIVVGIAGVLDLARRSQVPLEVVSTVAAPVPVPVALTASAGIAGFWAIVSHARPRAVALAAVAGALAWTVYSLTGLLGAGPVLASGAAAAVLGFAAEALTRPLRLPPQLLVVCGIIPLLPGLAVYGGLFTVVVDDDINAGLAALVGALAVGLALAAGVTLGEYLGRPLNRRRDRYDKRVRRSRFLRRSRQADQR